MRGTEGPQLLLVPGLIILTVAPFLSLSRGAAAAAVLGLFAVAVLMFSLGSFNLRTKIGFLAVFVIVAAVSWSLSAEGFKRRFNPKLNPTLLTGRSEIYENAQQIAEEYPIFGTGPGSFRSVYHLYREDVTQTWQAFVHDDWLETRLTFGWVGFSLVLTSVGPSWVMDFFAGARASASNIHGM